MDLLLVEDDHVLGKAIQRGLSDGGHVCTWVRSGQRGLDHASSQGYDALVLDLLLPDLPGWICFDDGMTVAQPKGVGNPRQTTIGRSRRRLR